MKVLLLLFIVAVVVLAESNVNRLFYAGVTDCSGTPETNTLPGSCKDDTSSGFDYWGCTYGGKAIRVFDCEDEDVCTKGCKEVEYELNECYEEGNDSMKYEGCTNWLLVTLCVAIPAGVILTIFIVGGVVGSIVLALMCKKHKDTGYWC